MKPTLILCVLALAGCAVGPNLQSRMSHYIGASSEQLVQGLGVPDKQITVNGTQYLAYDRHRTDVSPGFIAGGFGGFDGFYGGGFYGGPAFISPPIATDLSCETTFLLKDDHVQTFTMRGNDCSY
jgi:hypothetical protein